MQTGQKVVCINDTFAAWAHVLYKELPVKGITYTIRDVGIGRVMPNAQMCGGELEIAVTLVEIVNGLDPFAIDPCELMFNSNRFRELEEVKVEESIEEHSYA